MAINDLWKINFNIPVSNGGISFLVWQPVIEKNQDNYNPYKNEKVFYYLLEACLF